MKNTGDKKYCWQIILVTEFSNYFNRANCAMDRRTVWSLQIPGIQRQVLKHVKIKSERSMKNKEQKKNNENVLAVNKIR